ncbi:MAG: DUF5676 family membrane protein [Nanoarchaeota archaeon]|nr:DUF5676 family membrane protein [Nanoarchaeota archaeon]
MVDKLNTKKIALSLTIVSGILYIICALFVVIFPNFATMLFSNLFHGIDITRIATTNISFASILSGFIQMIIYAFIAGWLFAQIYNRLK